MIDLFCASFSRVPGRIVLDIDDTDDPAHGRTGTHSLQHPFGRLLLPAHAYLRGRLWQIGSVAAASWKEALGRGDRASSAARHCPDSA